MKKFTVFTYAAALLGALCIGFVSCNDEDQPRANDDNYGTDPAPVNYSPNNVVVLAVDYTTNAFLGGYTIPVEKGDAPFELSMDYVSPGDFGSVTFYDEASGTKLFAGDIIWMGCGKMTYPEAMLAPGGFAYAKKAAGMPRLTHYGGDWNYEGSGLTAVSNAISRLEVVGQALENAPDALVYAYLYARSVGMGNPAEWYWLVFIRG
ncbi:MAG: hypothetical protein LBV47_00875 [Bacteroidales bacterium]|nr:hypothetical protein [Bacteroidales bacterium]